MGGLDRTASDGPMGGLDRTASVGQWGDWIELHRLGNGGLGMIGYTLWHCIYIHCRSAWIDQ